MKIKMSLPKIKRYVQRLQCRNVEKIQQNLIKMLYKLFHSVLDQIISRWITAHYTSPFWLIRQMIRERLHFRDLFMFTMWGPKMDKEYIWPNWPLKTCPNSHYLQGVLEICHQISPLLNYWINPNLRSPPAQLCSSRKTLHSLQMWWKK